MVRGSSVEGVPQEPAVDALNAKGSEDDVRALRARLARVEEEKEALRHAKDELELRLARYAELYDFAPVGQLTLDAKSHILEVNRVGAALLGRERSRLRGEPLASFLTPSTRPHLEAFLAALKGTDRACCELTLSSRGLNVDVEMEGVREQGGSEEDFRCRAVMLELSGRGSGRRASSENKTDFLGMLAHRLRDPLAPIRNGLYLLEHAEPESAQAARAKDTIHRQTEHLTRLVQDLLDVARLSHGKLVLQPSRIDLREVVDRAVEELEPMFGQSGVELHVESGPRPVWVHADGVRMAQVVTSLIGNAVRFTPCGGEVWVGTAMSEGRAKLFVRDSGVGMDREQVERMFELFEQTEAPPARKGGLGVGLALAKGLVELHGGTIAARSDGPGRGSEFVVTLRLSSAGVVAPEPPAAGLGSTARRILVIDDNVDAGKSLAEILELHGYSVQVARDGRSGIAAARALRPDIVFCDIGLPDLDGYAIARTLRADDALRETRLIALSGFAQAEDRQRAREAGFEAHLSKPASPEALLSSVTKAEEGPAPRPVSLDADQGVAGPLG